MMVYKLVFRHKGREPDEVHYFHDNGSGLDAFIDAMAKNDEVEIVSIENDEQSDRNKMNGANEFANIQKIRGGIVHLRDYYESRVSYYEKQGQTEQMNYFDGKVQGLNDAICILESVCGW